MWARLVYTSNRFYLCGPGLGFYLCGSGLGSGLGFYLCGFQKISLLKTVMLERWRQEVDNKLPPHYKQTFDCINHKILKAKLSRTVGQSDSRTVGQSDSRTVGQSDSRTVGQSDSRTVGQSFSNLFLSLLLIFMQ